MSLRTRLLEWLGVPAEPETVERAPRGERLRRFCWLNASSIIAIAVVVAVHTGSMLLPGIPGAAGPVLLAWFLLDQRVFAWGIERWNITVPWQFRDTQDGESE